MTLKRYTNSVKTNRKIQRIPAEKRLGEYIRAGWSKRYAETRTARGRVRDDDV